MGFNRNIGLTVGMLMLSCNFAYSGQMFSIDPAQSYIETPVPSWVSDPYYGSFEFIPGGGYLYTPGWSLQWSLADFSLSGNFDGAIELSPWVQGVGHLGITQQAYNTGAPILGAFNLPVSTFSFYQSSGEISFDSNPCALDPFWPAPGPGWSCSGWSSGRPAYLSGTFDGKTLDVVGDSGGYANYGWDIYLGETPPPLDPATFPQQYYTYHIVANAVPEPGTFPLIFLGMLVLYLANRRKSSNE